MDLTWHALAPSSLTARQMHDLIRLRHEVFVREQDCPDYDDLDGLDTAEETVHVLGLDGDELAAYARVQAPGQAGPDARIGRVVVAPGARGGGLGAELVRRAVAVCERSWPDAAIGMAAQAHLVEMYAAAGFRPAGKPYLDDGIPHIDMVRTPG